MRTTLTVDDDVAAVLERLRKTREVSLKELINEALRRGLSEMTIPSKRRPGLRTRAVSLGGLRIAGIDNIAEALAAAEGENFK
jgi:ribbon-helix-helix CopG family protein